MARFEIRTVRPIVIGGIRFETNAVVGFLETDLPADEVLGSLRVNQLHHHQVDKAKPAAAKQTPNVAKDSKPPKPTGTPLDRDALNDKVVDVLEQAGITTIEQLREAIASGTDLTKLKGIGAKSAENLAAYAAQ